MLSEYLYRWVLIFENVYSISSYEVYLNTANISNTCNKQMFLFLLQTFINYAFNAVCVLSVATS